MFVPPDLVQPDEVFKAHPTWTHLYVSDHGRVWSTKSGKFVGYKAGHDRILSGVLSRTTRLRPTPKRSYMRVTCASGKPGVSVGVHALVLETFVGPRPTDYDADHINHDPLDNRLVNLRWRPATENRADNPKL